MRASKTGRSLVVALAASILGSGTAVAQSLVIDGATIHPVSGEPFVGRLEIIDGFITEVTQSGPESATAGGDDDGEVQVIDATGMHVYPGMFDALSQIGLVEVNAVPSTDDQAEMGLYNPHLSAATAFHPASEVIGVTRANGVTHSVVAPLVDGEGVIAGQATLVNLHGWTIEEMALDPAIAMVIQWPAIITQSFDFSTFSMRETPFAEAKETAEKKQNELRDWMAAARHYDQAMKAGSSRLDRDLRLEALAGVLDGKQAVVIVADAKRDIEAAIEFAEEQGLRMILGGGRDAWKVKETLAEKNIPVLLGMTQSLPNEDDDPYDQPYRTPGELVAAGVKIAFTSGTGGGFGPGGPHLARTTPYEASTAMPYGLSEEEAIKAMTLNPAEIFGVADRLGSIEVGKLANLIVTDGNPLEITTQIRHVIIAGEDAGIENRHDSLYERYRARELPEEQQLQDIPAMAPEGG